MIASKSVTKLDKSLVNQSRIGDSPLKANGKKKLSSAISFAKAKPANTKSFVFGPGHNLIKHEISSTKNTSTPQRFRH